MSSSIKRKNSVAIISDCDESESDEEQDDEFDDWDKVVKSRKTDDDEEEYSEIIRSKKVSTKVDSRSIRKSTLSQKPLEGSKACTNLSITLSLSVS